MNYHYIEIKEVENIHLYTPDKAPKIATIIFSFFFLHYIRPFVLTKILTQLLNTLKTLKLLFLQAEMICGHLSQKP